MITVHLHGKLRRRFGAVVCLVALAASGCETTQQHAVVPAPVVTKQASWDGNVQNSGIVDADTSGFHVTQHYLDRWDALLMVYGGKLVPTRGAGNREGITAEPPGTPFYAEGARWVFTAQARGCFGKMNQMRLAAQGP